MDRLEAILTIRRLQDSGQARRIREQAGVSVALLARSIGVQEATVWRWETGRSRPREDAALRWLAALERMAGDADTEPKEGGEAVPQKPRQGPVDGRRAEGGS
jgi:transcriptional regulator with XRE-family HTH domain